MKNAKANIITEAQINRLVDRKVRKLLKEYYGQSLNVGDSVEINSNHGAMHQDMEGVVVDVHGTLVTIDISGDSMIGNASQHSPEFNDTFI